MSMRVLSADRRLSAHLELVLYPNISGEGEKELTDERAKSHGRRCIASEQSLRWRVGGLVGAR